MSREIKFRAWVVNSVVKEMIYQNDTEINSTVAKALQYQIGYNDAYPEKNNIEEWQKNIKFMQYTGLKDKNGVDIYEGDIIYIAGYGNYIVEFPFFELYERIYCGDSNDIENVIGNIYQNPEKL